MTETFECNPCIEPSPPSVEFELFTEQVNARAGGQAWYPGAWQINMGGNGRVLNYITRDRVSTLTAEVVRLSGRLDKVEDDLDEERGWTRVLEDYIHKLRAMLSRMGADVPDWPARREGG